jgi:DDE superfamily endonuclease
MTNRHIAYWVIPPRQNADFVAHMENILAIYKRPYDPQKPVVCMDEQPVQLIRECHDVIPATATAPKRVDYEYERLGTASIFLFTEPLGCYRSAHARPTRTKKDWAQEVANLLDQRYHNGEMVTLICDNLNTHTRGAFYEAFSPEKAHAYLARLDLQYTPKHGSWLNIAENELSAMTRQCLAKRRIPTIDLFNHEISAWYHHVNSKQKGVVWHMTTELARDKLKSLYPVLSC